MKTKACSKPRTSSPASLLCGKIPATYIIPGYFPGAGRRPARDLMLCEECAAEFPAASPRPVGEPTQ